MWPPSRVRSSLGTLGCKTSSWCPWPHARRIRMTAPGPTTELQPLLRTLAPALRRLERNLRAWLDGPRRYPLSTMTLAALEGVAADLRRKADALDVDQPHLVIMFM